MKRKRKLKREFFKTVYVWYNIQEGCGCVKKYILLLNVALCVLLLSSCAYKSNKFKIDLDYERDTTFILETFEDLMKKNGHSSDLLVPYDHLGVYLTIENTKYLVDSIYYGIVTDTRDEEYVFTSYLCMEDEDTLSCFTDNHPDNTRLEVEESVVISSFLDTLAIYEIYDLIAMISEEFDVIVTEIETLYIRVMYYEDTMLDLEEEEEVQSIFIDGDIIRTQGQQDVDGFYIMYMFFGHSGDDTNIYKVYNKME